MGIGGALIMPSTLSILTAVFPAEERAQGDRRLGRRRGPRHRARPDRGRLARRARRLALGLHRQRPDRRRSRSPLGRALVPESRDPTPRPRRPPRRRAVHARPDRAAVGLIEAPDRGWTDPAILAAFAAAVARPRPVRRLGAAHARRRCSTSASSANRRFSAASVAIALAFFGLFGVAVLHDAVPAERARLQPARGRRLVAPGRARASPSAVRSAPG